MTTQQFDSKQVHVKEAIAACHSKLDLPLWVKLQHASPEHMFDVMLTLTHDPSAADVHHLQTLGLSVTPFHQIQPGKLLPGIISKKQLQENLLQASLVHYVEGLPHPTSPS